MRRGTFGALGGFDVALGSGTPSGGGEDLNFLVRAMFAEASIAYEPTAITWHAHRPEDDAIRRQLFAYGSGLTALATKQILSSTTRGAFLRRARSALRRRVDGVNGGGHALPADLLPHQRRTELSGMAAGPYLYLKGRAHGR